MIKFIENMLYDFLVKLGYEMSDEECQLRDGTHELFIRDNEDGKEVNTERNGV